MFDQPPMPPRPSNPKPPFSDLEGDAQVYLERAHKSVGLMVGPDDPRYAQMKVQANETALSYSQTLSVKRIADLLERINAVLVEAMNR